MKIGRFSIFLLLFVAFLDYMGLGLVFPLFASLLFDPAISPLHPETGGIVRGMWMGILISLTSLVQFFLSPILGSLSDQRGRKSIIILGLAAGLLGYSLGILGVKTQSLSLLILYWILFGISAATTTVIQAALVDISTPKTKVRNFSLYNMALGTGFAFGPFLGGKLSDSSLVSWFDYSTPFLLGLILTSLNLILLFWKFDETRQVATQTPLDIFKGLREAKKAFLHPTLRYAFLGFFLFVFGWDYFIEFVSVTLHRLYNFTTSQVGDFHAYIGLTFAIAVGFLIKPLVQRYSSRRILSVAMFAGGAYLLLFLLIQNPNIFWLFLPGLSFIIALFYPVASAYISDSASQDSQGEILGVFQSIQSLALILSPLITGSLIGAIPTIPVYLGGALMMVGGVVFGWNCLREKRKVTV